MSKFNMQASGRVIALVMTVSALLAQVSPLHAEEFSINREAAIRAAGELRAGTDRSAAIHSNSGVRLTDRKSVRYKPTLWGTGRHPDLPETRVASTPNESGSDVANDEEAPAIVTASASATVAVAPEEPPASSPTAAPDGLIPAEPKPSLEAEETAEKPELFVLVLVGDTGLNAHNQRVHPDKALRHGRGYAWDYTTKKIASLIDGHVNFANIETVVTTNNKLYASPKSFNFRMHPNGARHLVDVGFNLFSLANNHSADYGRAGVRDTLKESEKLRTAGLRGFAGLGVDRQSALQADFFSVGRARFGFAAMGIGARSEGPARAGVNKPGQVNIYGKADFDGTVDNLVAAPADYRILSLHFGAERNVRPLPGQVKKWRDEVLVGRDIDLIVGHHAHVVQGVQITDGKLIFYGLGNFLHMGMQDMGKFNACRDYGLLARVFVVRQPDGSMEAQAVQVVALKDMHLQARALTGKDAARRIDVLNMLAEELDDDLAGSRGVRFAKQLDGTGLYCRPGAENGPGRLGKLCQDFSPAPPFSAKERRRVRGMCGAVSRRVAGKRTSKRRKARRLKRKRKAWRGRKVFRRGN